MTTLYRDIAVWRRVSDVEAVRYACFENLGTGQFCVLQADFLRAPLDDGWQRRNHLELFLEGQLDHRVWRSSLQEAIAAHDALFENDFVEHRP